MFENYTLKMFEGMSDLDSIANVFWLNPSDPLNTFSGELFL